MSRVAPGVAAAVVLVIEGEAREADDLPGGVEPEGGVDAAGRSEGVVVVGRGILQPLPADAGALLHDSDIVALPAGLKGSRNAGADHVHLLGWHHHGVWWRCGLRTGRKAMKGRSGAAACGWGGRRWRGEAVLRPADGEEGDAGDRVSNKRKVIKITIKMTLV